MTLSEREVSEAKWLPFNEFNELLYSDDFAPHLMDFRDMISGSIKEYIKR